jgi:hypothetical protein
VHVVQISFFVDSERRSPDTLLDEWHSLVDIAGAIVTTGARVTVIQASMVPGHIQQSDVVFHFVAPSRAGARLTSSSAFRSLIKDLAPDVFHIHGLGFPQEVRALRDLAPKVPILLQDHADREPKFWRRRVWRQGAKAASGISFLFVPGDKAEARSATGMYGSPAVLWVAHLDANKDPLTVLSAVSEAALDLKELQLWCCYASAPLLSAVRSRIASDARLRNRVHLLGRVPHEEIERMMRAADLFVLGSHREGGNFSLTEALATGLTPIVTDIPSSRALIGNGTVGALWPCEDWRALADELRTASVAGRAQTRSQVRAYFDAQLSSDAIGRKFNAAYSRLIGSKPPALVAS